MTPWEEFRSVFPLDLFSSGLDRIQKRFERLPLVHQKTVVHHAKVYAAQYDGARDDLKRYFPKMRQWLYKDIWKDPMWALRLIQLKTEQWLQDRSSTNV